MFTRTDKVVMIDCELTCQDHNAPNYMPGTAQEVIQVGYALIDTDTLTISDSGSFYCKPVRSVVTPFCTELTGITPKQASKGLTYHALCKNLERKLLTRSRAWCGWGEEYKIFQEHCEYHHTQYPFNSTFLDLSTWFTLTYGQEINSGLDAALKYMNLEFEGRRHDGQADAINQARLMCKMMQESRAHRVKNDTPLPSKSLP